MEIMHTPGPWPLVETVHEKILSSWHVLIGDRQLSLFPFKRIYSEDRSQSGFVTDDQHMADARLIAAAPDLLAALQLAGNSAGFQYMIHETQDAINAAIAKATGVGER